MFTENGFIELAYSLIRIRDLDILLDTMLGRIRDMLQADAGSIFIYDEASNELVFKYTQNDSLKLPFCEFRMTADDGSIAGYCAVRNKVLRLNDVYQLNGEYPFRFNASFDDMSGYCTRSMLVFPINDINDRLIGVLQLINKKVADVPVNPATVDSVVIPFTENDEITAYSLSGILGMALENALLYGSIERMWEGFIEASMTAIDLRDRVTSGHSDRVTELTMALAEAVCADDTVFPDFYMTVQQMKALRYACMLHDFGKLVISEDIMQKSEKLYPGMLDVIKYRFALAKNLALINGRNEEVKELEKLLSMVEKANIPTVLDEETGQGIEKCLKYFFTDMEGNRHQLLTEREYQYLSIRRGSLTEEERGVIMSHVKHTYEFLIKIPWTAELKQVPAWAAMHHEQVRGGGYPFGLSGDEVQMQGRMMAIADVYDALTAQDRPYKIAVSVEKACDILKKEAENGALDGALVAFFIDKQIYNCLNRRKS